ncbi:MAG: LTA synthase family protein [Lachnospiraceae bacterium]|nr:LTA synthase family protein [Lachnospiraceae bacterium]
MSNNVTDRPEDGSKKNVRIFSTVTMLAAPLLLFLILELLFGSDPARFSIRHIAENLLVLYCGLFFWCVLTNHFHLSLILHTLFWLAFSLVNLCVLADRGCALFASDIILWRSAMEVAGNYPIVITPKSVIIAAATLLLLGVTFFVPRHKIFSSLKTRLAALCGLLLLSGITIFSIAGDNSLALRNLQYSSGTAYRQYGSALTITGSITLLPTQKPAGYSDEAANAIMQRYQSDDPASFDISAAPNVIVIMDEAFSDFETTYGQRQSAPSLPFFSSLSENSISGTMYVSIHAGQTANSEYEFLSGNSKAFLPGGVAPYQAYMKKDIPEAGLPHQFAAMGYEDLWAFHPYTSECFNRRIAYEDLGFQRFFTQEIIEDPEYLRNYISDKTDAEQVIRLYEQHKKEASGPMFLFNVTMQNHSPFGTKFENMEYPISVESPGCEGTDFCVYANLIRESDKAYESLIRYFEKEEQPTVIVIFGDHQPSVFPEADPEKPLQRFAVPFKIWANYDIPEQQDVVTSPTLLSTNMMELIGAPMTGYQKFLLDFEKEVPALSFFGCLDKDGNLWQVADNDSPVSETLNAYRILEYRYLFDRKDSDTDFFFLQGSCGISDDYRVQ